MSIKKRHATLLFSFAVIFGFTTAYAFADNSVVSPSDFFAQVLQTIRELGGLSWILKISAVVTLVIASMKVSFLNQLLWSKLGNFQAWLAPILGLVGGILSLTASGGNITLASTFAYLSAGAGAIILHELLDTIKAVPGIGNFWVQVIDTVEKTLGGPASEKGAA